MIGAREFSTLDFNKEPSAGTVDIIQLQERIDAIAAQRGSTIAVRMSNSNGVSWPSQKKAEKFLLSANGKVAFKEARVMDQMYLIIYSLVQFSWFYPALFPSLIYSWETIKYKNQLPGIL